MSLIIENGKVIRANGTMDQIIDDFNEYLEFIRETTIPVPKEQFNNLSENRNKLYGDYIEAIKANKDFQEQLNELQKVYDEVCASKEKLRIENSKIFRERDILQRECKELNEKCNVLQKAYDDVEVDKKSEDEEANNDLSSKPVKVYDSSSPYKTGDLAFIIERSCADPTDDSTIVVHITLAVYNGFTWGSLEGHVVETDCTDIVPIDTANYLIDYFGTPNISCTVRYHY